MPNEADRDHRQDILVKRATAVLGGEEIAKDWLSKPKRALGGQVPIETALSDEGLESVFALLGRIEHGVFS